MAWSSHPRMCQASAVSWCSPTTTSMCAASARWRTAATTCGGAELLHNFCFAGFGNLEFPSGSVPAAMVGKDVRRIKVETTSTGAYVGTVQKVFAHNKVQPGGWPNLNTGGFLGPLDLKFSPSGRSMWVVDFGGFFTKDSGAVGGFRCDPGGDCARGAKQ